MATRLCRATRMVAVVFAAALALSGCASLTDCPAIGYTYTGPALLKFSDALPGGMRVAACFGDGCEPVTVERGNGTIWTVPQVQPYQESGLIAPAHSSIRVVITSADGSVVGDAVHDIPITMQHTGVFGQCPGPFSFEPVKIASPKTDTA